MTGRRKALLHSLLALLLLGAFPGRALAEARECESCDRIARENPDVEIREIRIFQKDIFGPESGLPGWFPWGAVNRFHIRTAERLIRRELLFKEGDRLNPDLARETLRNLRERDTFRDERIECVLLGPGHVRIDVHLRENWSLIPIFQIQGVDTEYAVTLGLTEQNLLGRGKSLSLWGRKGAEARNTVIEDSLGAQYVDPHLLGSWYRCAFTAQDLETGEFLQAVAERPYYSLETPWAAGAFGTHFRRERRLIRNGVVAALFEEQDNLAEADFSFALDRGPPAVHRLGPFYRFERREVRDYRAATAEGEELEPPTDQTTSSPGIAYRRLGVGYIVEERISRFDRREDFNMANDLSASLAFSAGAFGADRDEWLFSLSDEQGFSLREGHFLLLNASAQGAWDGDRVRNGLYSVRYDHYLRETFLDRGPLLHTLHWLGSFDYGVHLEPDRLLGLGYPNGLRGYSRDAFTGDRRLLFSLEDRIFLAERLLRLVALGFLVFFDAGFVWDPGQSMDLADLRYDVGAGLRVALPAVAGASVLQITWGIPVGSGADPVEDSVFTVATSTGF